MNQSESQPQKQRLSLYVAAVQGEDGTIQKVFTNADYNLIWLQVTTESKSARGSWVIFDAAGRQIDGNFRSKTVSNKN